MIIIKNLVKKEKEFPKRTVFGSIILWELILFVIPFFFMIFGRAIPFNILSQIVLMLSGVVISIGITQLAYSIVKGKGQGFSIAFQFLTNPKTFKKVGILLLSYLIIGIGLILFIVPGIILIYAFGVLPFILIDEDYQSLSAIETLKKSYELMKENKIKLFLLQLRYLVIVVFFTFLEVFIILGLDDMIGYLGILLAIVLAVITYLAFIIFLIYISSKYYIALAIFYKQIKEDKTIQSIEAV